MRSQDKDSENKYSDYSDEELILRIREGEEQISEYILDKYKNMVRAKAGTMFILGADREDLIQEGMIGLFKAMRDFDSGRDASFATFADLCISRQMYTAVTASGRKKHIPLNSYVSLYDEGGEGAEGKPLSESVAATGQESDPEGLVIEKENIEAIEKWMETGLSSFEKQALELNLTGMAYTDVARVLGKDAKSTDNAIQRAKSKIRRFLMNSTE